QIQRRHRRAGRRIVPNAAYEQDGKACFPSANHYAISPKIKPEKNRRARFRLPWLKLPPLQFRATVVRTRNTRSTEPLLSLENHPKHARPSAPKLATNWHAPC